MPRFRARDRHVATAVLHGAGIFIGFLIGVSGRRLE
jgi:hypothetical protein